MRYVVYEPCFCCRGGCGPAGRYGGRCPGPQPSLLSYWNLDDAAGSTSAAASVGSTNLTPYGESGYYPTPQASALSERAGSFTAAAATKQHRSSELQNLSSHQNLVGLSDVSFGLWIYEPSSVPGSVAPYNPYLMEVRATTTTVAYYLDIQNPSGSTSHRPHRPRYRQYDSMGTPTSDYNSSPQNYVTVNAWTFLFATWQFMSSTTGIATLYKDGVAVASDTEHLCRHDEHHQFQ